MPSAFTASSGTPTTSTSPSRPTAGTTLPAGGLAWTPPIALTPKGLLGFDRWAIAVRGGEVAVSYLAQPPAKGPSACPPTAPTCRDGYLSVTMNPFVASPAVWAAMVNKPTAPLLTGPATEAKDDFIGVDIGPDGSPWASYFSPCSAETANAPAGQPDPAQHDPACQGAYTQVPNGKPTPANAQLEGGNDRGIVGSLLFKH